MGLLRALGLGLFLLILAIVMPPVFAALTRTLVAFLSGAEQAFTAAGILASYASQLPPTH